MSPSEVLFNLYTLLLGFILVEALSGLMRTLRARLPSGPGKTSTVKIGWLTPMLGAYTMLTVLMFWLRLYGMIDIIPFGYDTATLGLLLFSFYYYAASMVYPDKPRDWPDVDEWFWLHRRQVLTCLLLATLPFMIAAITRGAEQSLGARLTDIGVAGFRLAFFALAIFGRSSQAVGTGLGLLIALQLSFIPLNFLYRLGFISLS